MQFHRVNKQIGLIIITYPDVKDYVIILEYNIKNEYDRCLLIF